MDDYQHINAELIAILREAIELLRHVEWDSHNTETRAGNIIERARKVMKLVHSV